MELKLNHHQIVLQMTNSSIGFNHGPFNRREVRGLTCKELLNENSQKKKKYTKLYCTVILINTFFSNFFQCTNIISNFD